MGRENREEEACALDEKKEEEAGEVLADSGDRGRDPMLGAIGSHAGYRGGMEIYQ